MYENWNRRTSSNPVGRRVRRLTRSEAREEATSFLKRFFEEEEPRGISLASRLKEVKRELGKHGFYRHTPEELSYGARVAWRNHSNCIGRLHWKSLEVFDCREIREADEIAGQLMRHLELADNGGNIRSVISIFAPLEGDRTPSWIESPQLMRYAGYEGVNGPPLGDPMNMELTRTAMQLGWEPPQERSAFDLLPLIIRDEAGHRKLYALSQNLVREVRIAHPSRPAIETLGLKWYAVPVVCDMILTIGGIDYPCAPFNGYYMGTEIASRNFLDLFRYNMMEPLRQALGIDSRDPLYKDQASTELNRAVLWSFARDGVRMITHHDASEQFLKFIHHEKAAGRMPSANWEWIVPPEASASCPVFHQPMSDYHDVPNFYRSSATDGRILGVSHVTEDLNRHVRRYYRLRRRFRSWLRSKY